MGKYVAACGFRPTAFCSSGFAIPALRQYLGKNIGEVAKLRSKDPIETIMDLILEDRSRVDTVYFMMSEENVKKQLKLPWVYSVLTPLRWAAEGAFLEFIHASTRIRHSRDCSANMCAMKR
ncbi:MAG: hypothetical protein U0Y68_25805 [Blastocatellia bacterium]